ncbi:MAG: hypothetical protein IJY24_00630 [Clostridia bacterium]|nr:hypothetical protein [Clostridia bacterium]
MDTRNVVVDFSKRGGKMRPLNGINSGPLFGIEMGIDFTDEYKTLSVPFVRTDSVEPPHGCGRFVDIHCLFPDFNLDERFEASYNFAPTDKYLSAIKSAGADIFLRLGETPDPYEPRPFIKAPRDYEKYARICERIIAHYNEGWGRGLKLGIKYVEIMCCIDEPSGWSGSDEEYFELYRVVANHLRQRFPRIRIGAYSSGGFFSLNNLGASRLEHRYIDVLERFLEYITSPDTPAPLDFFSWRASCEDAEELSLHSNYARNYLYQYGLRRTQSIVTDFSLRNGDKPQHMEREYPAKLVAALITAQKSDIDMLFLSSGDPRSDRCPFFSTECRSGKYLFGPFRALEAFGELCRLGTEVETDGEYRRELSTLAATNGEEGAILVATRGFSGIIEIDVKGAPYTAYTLRGLIGGGERGEGYYSTDKPTSLKDGRILLRVGRYEVYLLSFSGGGAE